MRWCHVRRLPGFGQQVLNCGNKVFGSQGPNGEQVNRVVKLVLAQKWLFHFSGQIKTDTA
jgi:hypothetical protein